MFSLLAPKFEPQVEEVINDGPSQLCMQIKLLRKESLSISYFSLSYALTPPLHFYGFILILWIHITTSSQLAW